MGRTCLKKWERGQSIVVELGAEATEGAVENLQTGQGGGPGSGQGPSGEGIPSVARGNESFGAKTGIDLAAIARDEEIKLVQEVFLSGKTAPKVVLFCGVERGNGCSRVCAGSAALLAGQISGTVGLVDADLRCPTLHRIFGVNNGPGFADALRQPGAARSLCRRVTEGLWLMTCGTVARDPLALLTASALRSCMNELREAFDFVVIDVPPANSGAEAPVIGSLSDGIVLVIGANSTGHHAARKAAETLRANHCNIIAAVLNRRTYPIPDCIYRRLWP